MHCSPAPLSRSFVLASLLPASLLLASGPARALAPLQPTLDWTLSGAGFAAGAETSIAPGLRQPLWDRPGNALLETTYLQANALVQVTPAYSRGGIELAFQPAAVFELRAQYSVAAYYGLFSAVIPFDDPVAATDPDARALRPRTWGWGSRVSVQPTLRAKVGPIAVIGWTTLRWEDIHPQGLDAPLQYWFQPEMTLLVAQSAWTIDSNALVVYQLPVDGPTVYVGVYGTDRESPSTGDRLDRVGPAGVFTTANEHWSVYGIVQAYVASRIFQEPLPPYLGVRLQYTL